jgi:hypothetical protein
VSIYYSPEKFAARIVGDVDTYGGYEFNMIAVFQRLDDGALFYDVDSGCSCVSPFEDANTIGDLTRIDDPADFANAARKWLRESYDTDADDRDAVEKLIRKVRDEFRKKGLRK